VKGGRKRRKGVGERGGGEVGAIVLGRGKRGRDFCAQSCVWVENECKRVIQKGKRREEVVGGKKAEAHSEWWALLSCRVDIDLRQKLQKQFCQKTVGSDRSTD